MNKEIKPDNELENMIILLDYSFPVFATLHKVVNLYLLNPDDFDELELYNYPFEYLIVATPYLKQDGNIISVIGIESMFSKN